MIEGKRTRKERGRGMKKGRLREGKKEGMNIGGDGQKEKKREKKGGVKIEGGTNKKRKG